MGLFSKKRKRGYFDSGSFTPLHPQAHAAIREVLDSQMTHRAGNPLSAHERGRKAKRYMDEAGRIIGDIHRIKKDNVLFTASATEANLLAARTAVLHALRRGVPLSDMHFVIGHEEHPSMYQVVSYFGEFGIQHSIAAAEDAVTCIRETTVFLSIQYVNSQHGRIHRVPEIAEQCRAAAPSLFVHTDAAQATAYFDCSPFTLNADAVTIDGAKSFGPQGAAALLFQNALTYTGLSGKHTLWDMRPGTPAVAVIYGFAAALQEAHRDRERNRRAVRHLRDMLIGDIAAFTPDALVHGIGKKTADVTAADREKLAPHLLHLTFPDTQHDYLAALLDRDGFAVSTKTACTTESIEALRISVLPETTEGEVRSLVRCIRKHLPLARKV